MMRFSKIAIVAVMSFLICETAAANEIANRLKKGQAMNIQRNEYTRDRVKRNLLACQNAKSRGYKVTHPKLTFDERRIQKDTQKSNDVLHAEFDAVSEQIAVLRKQLVDCQKRLR